MSKYDLHNISASRLLNLLEPGLRHRTIDAIQEKADTIIIPAPPGWFVGTVFDDNTLDKDAVIAGELRGTRIMKTSSRGRSPAIPRSIVSLGLAQVTFSVIPTATTLMPERLARTKL